MSGHVETRFQWPPQCCVPAFVHGVLVSRGLKEPTPRALAHKLGVRVGPSDENPFDLPRATDPRSRGVSSVDAVERINSLLKEESSTTLAFRHIPFHTIAFEQYGAVLEAALAAHCSVGVGVDPLRLGLDARPDERHLVALVGILPSGVTYRDDSAGGRSGEVAWFQLEVAVAAVGDGYWVIGDEAGLSLPECLPYRPRTR